MFQILIDDVYPVRGIALVSGVCKNRNEFVSTLFDDDGMEYSAHIPFIKHVIMPDFERITLELHGVLDLDRLKGRTLRAIS